MHPGWVQITRSYMPRGCVQTCFAGRLPVTAAVHLAGGACMGAPTFLPWLALADRCRGQWETEISELTLECPGLHCSWLPLDRLERGPPSAQNRQRTVSSIPLPHHCRYYHQLRHSRPLHLPRPALATANAPQLCQFAFTDLFPRLQHGFCCSLDGLGLCRRSACQRNVHDWPARSACRVAAHVL